MSYSRASTLWRPVLLWEVKTCLAVQAKCRADVQSVYLGLFVPTSAAYWNEFDLHAILISTSNLLRCAGHGR